MGDSKFLILHLTTSHAADDTRVWHRQAMSARAAGFRVAVVARPSLDPAFEGEMLATVRPRRSRLVRVMGGNATVVRAASRADASIVQFHDPELLPAAIVLRLRLRGRAAVIFDLHENLSFDLGTRLWARRLPKRALRALGVLVMRSCVLVAEQCFAATEDIQSCARTSGQVPVILRNLPLDSSEGTRHGSSGRVCMTGAVDPSRGLGILIEGLRVGLPPAVTELNIAGPVRDATALKELLNLDDRVKYHGSLSPADVAALQRRCDVGLALYDEAQATSAGISTKLLEYLANGLVPIVSFFPHGVEVAEALGRSDLVVRHGRDLTNALGVALRLADEGMSLESAEAGSWKSEEEAMLTVYRTIAERLPRSSLDS